MKSSLPRLALALLPALAPVAAGQRTALLPQPDTDESHESFSRDAAPHAHGACSGAFAVELPPGVSLGGVPAGERRSGPLQIVAEWDATLLSSNDENYVFTPGSNKLQLRINGVFLPVIVFPAITLTADEVADVLDAVPAFAAECDARGWNSHNGGGTSAEAVLLRTHGASFGTIEVLNTADSAHNVLGFALGTTTTQVDAARRIIFRHAFDEWEALIQDGGEIQSPYIARVGYRPSRPLGALASAGPITSGGLIVGGVLNFDSTENWFEDPSPADDIEFENGSVPLFSYDLLTVARHEIGHALGFIGSDGLNDRTTTLAANLPPTATTCTVTSTAGFLDEGTFHVGGEIIEYTSKTPTQLLGLTRNDPQATYFAGATVTSRNIYDRNRLNIGVYSAGDHTHDALHPNDLMNPTIGSRTRRPISLYPDVVRISRGRDATVPMVVLDPQGAPSPDGRAGFPFPDIESAAAATPSGIPFLMTNGTYLEPSLPTVVTSAHLFHLARDAFVVAR